MSKFPSQLQDKFNLRFPDGMRDDIAERAKRNGRSMNSEIVSILEDALYCGDGDLDDMNANEMLALIKVQAALLEKYSEAVKRNTETLETVTKIINSNKKPI